MEFENENRERQQLELSLLESMYPDETSFDAHRAEFTYRSNTGDLTLRLPSGYPYASLPEVLAAHVGAERADIRGDITLHLKDLDAGQEVLDELIGKINEIAIARGAGRQDLDRGTDKNCGKDAPCTSIGREAGRDEERKVTIVVWLHHLLNTAKRKHVLNPNGEVSGVSKPGYPGVLVFSGVRLHVLEHVNELKQLNWQAFQVRLEQGMQWHFGHGNGIKEVESMRDVILAIGADKKEVFLEAMRIK